MTQRDTVPSQPYCMSLYFVRIWRTERKTPTGKRRTRNLHTWRTLAGWWILTQIFLSSCEVTVLTTTPPHHMSFHMKTHQSWTSTRLLWSREKCATRLERQLARLCFCKGRLTWPQWITDRTLMARTLTLTCRHRQRERQQNAECRICNCWHFVFRQGPVIQRRTEFQNPLIFTDGYLPKINAYSINDSYYPNLMVSLDKPWHYFASWLYARRATAKLDIFPTAHVLWMNKEA